MFQGGQRPMKPVNNNRTVDLACIGSIATDLLMAGVAAAPAAGSTALATNRILHPGGGGPNTAMAAAKLGLSVRIFGRVGDDLFGQFVQSELTKAGVLGEGLVDSTLPTGLSVVLTSNAERSFIYHAGCNDEFRVEDIDLDILKNSRCVHFSDPFELPDFTSNVPRLLEALVNCGCLLSMDAGWDTSNRWLAAIQDCLPYLDLFFCNRVESERLTNYPTPEDAARFLIRECGVKQAVIIKLDHDGCLVCSRHSVSRIPAFPATVRDPTGAGDCFCAAFLAGRLAGWNHEQSALLANAAGAFAISTLGATSGLPGLEELLAFAGLPEGVKNDGP